jgi:hypothetical protein
MEFITNTKRNESQESQERSPDSERVGATQLVLLNISPCYHLIVRRMKNGIKTMLVRGNIAITPSPGEAARPTLMFTRNEHDRVEYFQQYQGAETHSIYMIWMLNALHGGLGPRP